MSSAFDLVQGLCFHGLVRGGHRLLSPARIAGSRASNLLFAKPARMESFLALYIQTSKEDIRDNRNNVAERLGFLDRIVHGVSPRACLHELRRKLGEPMD